MRYAFLLPSAMLRRIEAMSCGPSAFLRTNRLPTPKHARFGLVSTLAKDLEVWFLFPFMQRIVPFLPYCRNAVLLYFLHLASDDGSHRSAKRRSLSILPEVDSVEQVKTSTVSSAFRWHTAGLNGAVTAFHNLFPARFFSLYLISH